MKDVLVTNWQNNNYKIGININLVLLSINQRPLGIFVLKSKNDNGQIFIFLTNFFMYFIPNYHSYCQKK